MNLEDKILTMSLWGRAISSKLREREANSWLDDELSAIIRKAGHMNGWFTEENILRSIEAICENYLDEKKIRQWVGAYPAWPENPQQPKSIGLTMAGNLPLVGFHDLLCVLMSGHKAVVKLSSKDAVLLPYLLQILFTIEPQFEKQVEYGEMLKGCHAYIATGSDNSARYFEYYFGKYPHIIRKNRNSLAILTGSETDEVLLALGQDVFSYFGLGCRNVSKLLVPPGYEFDRLLKIWEHFDYLANHHKYKSNFDYQLTLLLMNRVPYQSNAVVLLTENTGLHSPISVLYYEKLNHEEILKRIELAETTGTLQCIVGQNQLSFGSTQSPQLWDYADGIDTLKWLLSL